MGARSDRKNKLSSPPSDELIRGPPELVQHFRLQGGVHIGAIALHVLNLIWLGSIARLSQWRGGGSFPRSNDLYLPSPRVEEGGRGSASCGLLV